LSFQPMRGFSRDQKPRMSHFSGLMESSLKLGAVTLGEFTYKPVGISLCEDWQGVFYRY
jgi:hypothetical protein